MVDLGDRWDFRSLSKFESDVHKSMLQLRFSDDKKAGIEWGDSLHEALPKNCKKVICLGNHEVRCDKYVNNNFVLDGLIEVNDYLKKNDYHVVPHKGFQNIGHLYFTHGDLFGGLHHAKTYALKTGKSVVYGHAHQFQSYFVHHLTHPHGAWSIGMMAEVGSLDFYAAGPKNWMTGFAYVYILPNGNFNIYPVVIVDNMCVIEGKVYDSG